MLQIKADIYLFYFFLPPRFKIETEQNIMEHIGRKMPCLYSWKSAPMLQI